MPSSIGLCCSSWICFPLSALLVLADHPGSRPASVFRIVFFVPIPMSLQYEQPWYPSIAPGEKNDRLFCLRIHRLLLLHHTLPHSRPVKMVRMEKHPAANSVSVVVAKALSRRKITSNTGSWLEFWVEDPSESRVQMVKRSIRLLWNVQSFRRCFSRIPPRICCSIVCCPTPSRLHVHVPAVSSLDEEVDGLDKVV